MSLRRHLLLGLALAWAGTGAFASPRKAPQPPPPPPVQGVVTQVVDGNTLTLTVPGQAPLLVRLRDIDAPSLCQPWGEEARRSLADIALNKPARLLPSGRDAQGRTVGAVSVEVYDQELDLSRHLVEEGDAWSQRTRNGHGPLLKQERMAEALRRGLHGAGGALMPADYVRAHGPCIAAPAAASAARR